MALNYTTLLGLVEPVTGTEDGTWGDDVSKGLTQYLDIAIAGTQTISGSQTAVTLSITNGSSVSSNIDQVGAGATGSAQYQIINCTGNPAGMLTITAPASSKTYILINATSTNQNVKLVAAGPTTGVTIGPNKKALIVWNGSDFATVAGVVNLATDVTGTLAAANGGTGQSSYTTGDTLYASGSTALSKLPVGTTGQVLTVAGGIPTWATPASGLPDQAGHAGEYLTTDGTNASWTATGAAAGGGIFVNNDVISTSYTIQTGQNGFSVGPMTISDGYSVTVSSGQRWIIL